MYTKVSGNPCRVGNSAKAPHTPQNRVVTRAYMSHGLDISEAVRNTGYVAAAISTIAITYAAGALTHQLARSPGQLRVAVEVSTGNRVGQVAAFDIHLKALEGAPVNAGGHPGERIGDRGKPWDLRAFAAVRGVAGG